MFASLPALIRVPLAVLLLACNIFVHVVPLFVVAMAKFVVPIRAWRQHCSLLLAAIAESWIGVNNKLFDAFTRIRWQFTNLPDLRHDHSYMVLCNHQSWVDIPVLQRLFNRQIPLLRFFLKSQLIWVPLLGLAWWALDFPFMKRYGRAQLQRNPKLKGRDREAARRACEKYRDLPVSIMNFAEGTRFTPAKHARQHSPYAHLLKPKAGGVAYVFAAMGEVLHSVLDVTIAYRGGAPSMMDVILGKVHEVDVHVQEIRIDPALLGSYDDDPARRARLQRWVNELWQAKDERISHMLGEPLGASKPEVPLHFRAATELDVDAIVALVESSYRGEASRAGWTTEADLLDGQRIDRAGVAEVISKPQSRVMLAEQVKPDKRELLACCHIEPRGDACYFGMFSVRPTLQRGGVGSNLLAEAERVAQTEWHCSSMRMTVIDVRDDLIGWYERRGYSRRGEYAAFPYGDERFGIPKRDDLRFEWLSKPLPLKGVSVEALA